MDQWSQTGRKSIKLLSLPCLAALGIVFIFPSHLFHVLVFHLYKKWTNYFTNKWLRCKSSPSSSSMISVTSTRRPSCSTSSPRIALWISMSCAQTRSIQRVSSPHRWAGFLGTAVILFGIAFAFVVLPFLRSVLILLIDASTISTSLSSTSFLPSPSSLLPLAKLMVHRAVVILCPSAICIACNSQSAVISLARWRYKSW